VAFPANASDPLLVQWAKDSGNRVVADAPAGGFRDNTTACTAECIRQIAVE
jgi:hypothetical protein